jgi:DNA-binding CsgD family transcriptional regulator
VADWPLVGRADELGLLRELLTGREPRGVVLAGPSGVGKTRLAHEALVVAERAGLAIAQATATRSATELPFGALAPLLPEQPADPGVVDDRADLLRRSVSALAERSGDQRLLLFVDDAHLLDDASAILVHQLAATGVATVLATVRTGVPAPDPVVSLWKDGLAERVELEGLDGEATADLLAKVLGGPVDPGAAVQFTERCRGNALFLRELVLGALDDGSLRDDNGIWRLDRALSPSARLVEIVEARLGQLDERERALLELVSYGEPLGHAELTALTDPELAESLERRDLLASEVDGRRLMIYLAHPLYGDVVRARTPALRARAIATSLADAVEATGAGRRGDVLRVAGWRLMAGGGHPDELLAGATIARWRYDFPLAERLARAAIDAGAGFDAELLAAQLASLQGRTADAERELADLAGRTTDDAQRGKVAIARFDNSVAWIGRDREGILDAAEESMTDPEWRDRIDARRIGVLLNTRGPRASVEAALPILSRAKGEALVVASVLGAYSLVRLGRLHAALDTSARGHAARRTLTAPLAWYPWWHVVTRALALQHLGRFHEAEEVVAERHRRALDEGSDEAQAIFADLAANPVLDRGHVRTAARHVREALALNQRLGRPLLIRSSHIFAALALALAGRADEAADELAALDALGLPPVYLSDVELHEARGWTAAAAGDLPAARRHLEEAADLGAEIGDLLGEATALHGLARIGRAKEVRDRLAEVASRIDGQLAPARTAHVSALVRGDAFQLEKVSEDFEAMGADLLAAESAADAAVARRQAGELREAAADERRAAVLAERAEDPVTPALQAVEARARLTPAERETAVLAARGRSNRDIAEQLFLSPRTVENRLQRVYEKLGVSGRTELAEALALED